MWIKARSMDAKRTIQLDGLSRTTNISTLRKNISIKLDTNIENLNLYFRGKQVSNNITNVI